MHTIQILRENAKIGPEILILLLYQPHIFHRDKREKLQSVTNFEDKIKYL